MDIFFLVVSTIPPNRNSHLDENGKVKTQSHRHLQVRKGPADASGSPIFERSRVVKSTPMPSKFEEEQRLWRESEKAISKANGEE